jgi:hypothetical protein
MTITYRKSIDRTVAHNAPIWTVLNNGIPVGSVWRDHDYPAGYWKAWRTSAATNVRHFANGLCLTPTGATRKEAARYLLGWRGIGLPSQ